MANTTIADVITWVAAQVTATTPPVATEPVDTAFVRATPSLPTFEPNGGTIFRNHDRLFEIRITSRRELEVGGGYADRTILQGIDVEILYVVSLSRAELDARIGRDAEAIENRLALRTGTPTGVKLVNPLGASVKRNHQHQDVWSQTLSFAIQYQLATT